MFNADLSKANDVYKSTYNWGPTAHLVSFARVHRVPTSLILVSNRTCQTLLLALI